MGEKAHLIFFLSPTIKVLMSRGLTSDTWRDNTQKIDSKMLVTPGSEKQATIHKRLKKSILKEKKGLDSPMPRSSQ